MKQAKNLRLKLINSDLQGVLGGKGVAQVQQPEFSHVEVFSHMQRVNSVMRTLIALGGKEDILYSARTWFVTNEGILTRAEEEELFAAVERIVRNPSARLVQPHTALDN